MKIVLVETIKAGMNGKKMMEAQARGKVYDPNAIVRVDVTVEQEEGENVANHDSVRRFLVFEATSSFGASGVRHLPLTSFRFAAGPFQRGGKWRVRWEVE